MTNCHADIISEKYALAERLKKRHSVKDLWKALRFDMEQYFHYSSDFMDHKESLLRIIGLILTPAVSTTLLYRIAHWFWLYELRRSAIFVTHLNFFANKAYISPSSTIGPGFYIAHPYGCVFEGNAGVNFTMYPFTVVSRLDTETMDIFQQMPLSEIGNNVKLALLTCVKSGCRIADGANVGPINHLQKDIPQNAIVISINKNIQATIG